MRNIDRRIYFYDTKLETYDETTNAYREASNYQEKMIELFNSIEELEYDKVNLQQSKYLKKANGTYDFIKVDKINANCIKGKLINSDDSGLTYYEQQGDLKFLKDIITGNREYIRSSTFCHFSRYQNYGI